MKSTKSSEQSNYINDNGGMILRTKFVVKDCLKIGIHQVDSYRHIMLGVYGG